MSKRLSNYPDPLIVLGKYGAGANDFYSYLVFKILTFFYLLFASFLVVTFYTVDNHIDLFRLPSTNTLSLCLSLSISLSFFLSFSHTHSISLPLTLHLSLPLSHTHTLSLSLTHTHSISLSLTRTLYLSISHIHTLSLSLTRTLYLSISHIHTLSLSLPPYSNIDALRLYLINSPVVRADVLKFQEEGKQDEGE